MLIWSLKLEELRYLLKIEWALGPIYTAVTLRVSQSSFMNHSSVSYIPQSYHSSVLSFPQSFLSLPQSLFIPQSSHSSFPQCSIGNYRSHEDNNSLDAVSPVHGLVDFLDLKMLFFKKLFKKPFKKAVYKNAVF